MNPIKLLALLVAILPAFTHAENPDEDKTFAPYFQIITGDAGGEFFPLKSTAVDAHISGVIAEVEVVQTYANLGDHPIEALYVFPASTRAAVHGMTMQVGDRTIHAVVREKREAKATYEKAKAENKRASLLEQHRPNVFQMSVANILPGDEVKVTLHYTETLVPVEKEYGFVFPTVVGPRYNGTSENPGAEATPTAWVANPFLTEGEPTPATFAINVQIDAGMPLQKVACTTHPIKATYEGETTAKITLDPAAGDHSGDRDFILSYRLAGDQIASGLILHKSENPDAENYFLLTVQPPNRQIPDEIPPRDYVFVVDVSGSMNGFPLDVAKNLLRDLIRSLKPTDTFNIILFAASNRALAEKSLPATEGNLDRAVRLLESQSGGGGTELLPALHRALNLPAEEGRARSIVVVTDGFVTIEREAFELVRNSLDKASLFSFGIGSSVNRHLVEGLAKAGRGEPLIITSIEDAKAKAARFREYISAPVLTGIKVNFDGFDTYDIEPKSIPDIFADRPLVLFGKWRGTPAGTIRITGHGGERERKIEIDVKDSPASSQPALPYLWARERIAALSDFGKPDGKDAIAEITNLGLTYNLLTEFTSFVAVDEVVTAQTGPAHTVKQPSPLPQGVPNSAVGGGQISTTPEPDTYALIAVLLAALAFHHHRLRRKNA